MLQRLFIYFFCALFCSLSIAAPAQQLPSLGDSASAQVSLLQEHELGRLWLRQLRAQTNVIDLPLAVQFLEQSIYRMVPHSDVQINDFEFVIIDQRELNAFAVPGGIIGINFGLFLHANDEDELSAVLAHELAHLSQRHFSRQLEQADRQAPIAIATLLASILLIATNNPDVGFAGLIGSQAASIQSQLAYSREWEREADRLGIKTLANADLDPSAMPSMFHQMLQASRYQQRPPEFLLTHPVTESRIAGAADRAEQYPTKARTAGFEFYILQNKAIQLYRLQGDQTFVYFNQTAERAQTNSVEQAAAQYSLADLYLQQNKAEQAMQHWQKIPANYRKHNASIALQALILQQLNQEQQALEVLANALPFTPNDFLLLTTQAQVLQQQGKVIESNAIWRKLSELRPSNPYVWKQLSHTANLAQQKIMAYRANAEFLFYSGQHQQALRQMDMAQKQAKVEGDLRQQLAIKQRQQDMASAPSKF